MQKKQVVEGPTWMTIGDAAKYLGVSRDTLRRWDKKWGGAKAVRSPSNHRYYTKKQLDQLMSSARGEVVTDTDQPLKVNRSQIVTYSIIALFVTLSFALTILYLSSNFSQ